MTTLNFYEVILLYYVMLKRGITGNNSLAQMIFQDTISL
jgi:hypothetical protein